MEIILKADGSDIDVMALLVAMEHYGPAMTLGEAVQDALAVWMIDNRNKVEPKPIITNSVKISVDEVINEQDA